MYILYNISSIVSRSFIVFGEFYSLSIHLVFHLKTPDLIYCNKAVLICVLLLFV